MTKRTKFILGIVLGFVIISAGTFFTLAKLGIINFGIFADVNNPILNLVVDPNKGEVFSEKVDKAIGANQYKISAIPKTAGWRFKNWQTSSPSCYVLDGTKAISIASVSSSCKITANFEAVIMTDDHTGYETICSSTDFNKIRTNLSGKFVQTCDIDLSGISFEPIGKFLGTYDGNGKFINHLSINKPEGINLGVFSENNGTILNITLQNVNISGGKLNIAGLVGRNSANGSIQNVIVTGKITGKSPDNYFSAIGGVTAENLGLIENVAVNVSISASATLDSEGRLVSQSGGGIAGRNFDAIIRNSYSLGSIQGMSSRVGGAVGWNSSGFRSTKFSEINNVSSAIDVAGTNVSTGQNLTSDSIGGLIGYSQGSQKYNGSDVAPPKTVKLFSIGNVSGGSNIGGLIGYVDQAAEINSSYTIGSTINGTSTTIGGFIGGVGASSYTASITNSYANTHIQAGNIFIGGFIGNSGIKVSTKNCLSTGVIDATHNDSSGTSNWQLSFIGGFIGQSSGGDIENSSAKVKINAQDGTIIGGLIGKYTSGKITNSLAQGSIKGKSGISGFVAGLGSTVTTRGDVVGNPLDPFDRVSSIYNSYAAVSLSPQINDGSCGFLCSNGDYNEGEVKGLYWDKDIAGTNKSVAGEGKTSAEMKTKSTFVGWNFGKIWKIDEGKGYPILQSAPTQFSRFETSFSATPVMNTASTTPIATTEPTCTPLQPETKNVACPTGQTGSITQTRTSSCPGPAWSEWEKTANTCVATPTTTLTTPAVKTAPVTGTVTGYKTYKFWTLIFRRKIIISNASVQISSGQTVKTDAKGNFSFNALPVGNTYNVWAWATSKNLKCGVSDKYSTKVGSGVVNIALNCY